MKLNTNKKVKTTYVVAKKSGGKTQLLSRV